MNYNFERYNERLLIERENFVVLEIINSIYVFLKTEEVSFVLLKKLHTVCAVSLKSIK